MIGLSVQLSAESMRLLHGKVRNNRVCLSLLSETGHTSQEHRPRRAPPSLRYQPPLCHTNKGGNSSCPSCLTHLIVKHCRSRPRHAVVKERQQVLLAPAVHEVPVAIHLPIEDAHLLSHHPAGARSRPLAWSKERENSSTKVVFRAPCSGGIEERGGVWCRWCVSPFSNPNACANLAGDTVEISPGSSDLWRSLTRQEAREVRAIRFCQGIR